MSEYDLSATMDAIERTLAVNNFQMYYEDLAAKFNPYISAECLSDVLDVMLDNGRLVSDGDGLLKVVIR
jgi:hypothetical protein